MNAIIKYLVAMLAAAAGSVTYSEGGKTLAIVKHEVAPKPAENADDKKAAAIPDHGKNVKEATTESAKKEPEEVKLKKSPGSEQPKADLPATDAKHDKPKPADDEVKKPDHPRNFGTVHQRMDQMKREMDDRMSSMKSRTTFDRRSPGNHVRESWTFDNGNGRGSLEWSEQKTPNGYRYESHRETHWSRSW